MAVWTNPKASMNRQVRLLLQLSFIDIHRQCRLEYPLLVSRRSRVALPGRSPMRRRFGLMLGAVLLSACAMIFNLANAAGLAGGDRDAQREMRSGQMDRVMSARRQLHEAEALLTKAPTRADNATAPTVDAELIALKADPIYFPPICTLLIWSVLAPALAGRLHDNVIQSEPDELEEIPVCSRQRRRRNRPILSI
jgi:hypothetical protein